jgi:hypothetical protein
LSINAAALDCAAIVEVAAERRQEQLVEASPDAGTTVSRVDMLD